MDAMGQFEHEPFLTGANAKIQSNGKTNRRNKTRDFFFLKIGPLRKFGVSPS
jgi:hypothetical protein